MLSLFHFVLASEASASRLGLRAIDGHVFYRLTGREPNLEWRQLRERALHFDVVQDPAEPKLVHAVYRPEVFDRLIQSRDRLGLAKRMGISASLLSPEHSVVTAGVGFVIAAPAENILAADSQDLNSPLLGRVPVSEMERARRKLTHRVRKRLKSFPLRSPEEILRHSSRKGWNEVFVTGTTLEGGPVEIVGVFIAEHQGKPFAPPFMLKRARKAASALEVPLVFIRQGGS